MQHLMIRCRHARSKCFIKFNKVITRYISLLQRKYYKRTSTYQFIFKDVPMVAVQLCNKKKVGRIKDWLFSCECYATKCVRKLFKYSQFRIWQIICCSLYLIFVIHTVISHCIICISTYFDLSKRRDSYLNKLWQTSVAGRFIFAEFNKEEKRTMRMIM